MVYTVDLAYTVDMVYTVDTVNTVYTVYTVYTIQTTLGKDSRKKSSCYFGFCPNYLHPPLPLPPIWTTCTTFLERQKRQFKRHSRWLIIQKFS